MARKWLIALLCFLVTSYQVQGFLVPKSRTTTLTPAGLEQSDLSAEIEANERKIANMTQQLSDDYKKYSYLITTYL